jgi:hypothetical protein
MQKMQKNAGNFECHGNVVAQGGAHPPIEHIKGFTRSHWMMPPGKYWRRSTPAATMITILVENSKH